MINVVVMFASLWGKVLNRLHIDTFYRNLFKTSSPFMTLSVFAVLNSGDYIFICVCTMGTAFKEVIVSALGEKFEET